MLVSDGVFALNEDALCIYADLDRLIEKAGLSPLEQKTVEFLMYGYSIPDIADTFGKSRQLYEILFRRAIKKIVRANDLEWEEWSGGRIDDD